MQRNPRPIRTDPRRGLTLLELMMSLTITVLVAGAIWAMLGAVMTGVDTRRDNREIMVRSAAIESRLNAYVAPSNCVLDLTGISLVLWLSDARESDTVHGTEIRWIMYNNGDDNLYVFFVDFPDGWTQAAKDLEDKQHRKTSNWTSVLGDYNAKGYINYVVIGDNLDSFGIALDAKNPQDARHVTFDLGLATPSGVQHATITATIRQHEAPQK
jgi:hypothetical protein